MAGNQVSKTTAIDWFIAGTYQYESVSIDELNTTSEPQILQGSRLEVGSDIYEFPANESITGWAGLTLNQDAYIKIVPAGATCTAEFTQTAPTWDDDKRGWYNSGDRYIYIMNHYTVGGGATDTFTPKTKLRAPNDGNITIDQVLRGSVSAIEQRSQTMSTTALSTLFTAITADLIMRDLNKKHYCGGYLTVSAEAHIIVSMRRANVANDVVLETYNITTSAGDSIYFDAATATTATGEVYW